MEAQISIEELTRDLQPRKFGISGQLWTALLCVVILNGLVSYYFQLRDGLCITGMSNSVSWGIYISNFVFFVAISLVGSLISAILKLSNAKWSIPLTRIAEIIAVANIAFAGLIIIVDMGRPDRIFNLFTHGRIQSPIVWDVLVVTTYLAISTLLLYIPLLPDLAILRENMKGLPKWQHRLYSILSLGWKGSEEQYDILHKSVRTLAIIIIPVALGIHTVTSWLFASTLRGGWNSTNFGPYFVAGAFVVGAASVISLMFVARRHYQLEKYITDDLFDKMGKLLVMLSLIYTYFTINEYLTPAFKMMGGERGLIEDLFVGNFAPMFWGVQIFGVLIPVVVMLFKKGRKPWPLFIVANMTIVGAWFKRYLIVIPTLFHPYLPAVERNGVPKAIQYIPTWNEWSITLASLAGSLLIITILFRYLPFISMWEIAEEEGIDHAHINPTKIKSRTEKLIKVVLLLFPLTIVGNTLLAADKASPKLRLTYIKHMGGAYEIKAKAFVKKGKEITPCAGATIGFYTDADYANVFGKQTADEEGQTTLLMDDKDANRFKDSAGHYKFYSRVEEDSKYESQEADVSALSAVIDVKLEKENDSTKTVKASVTCFDESNGKMIPGVKIPLKFLVKRAIGYLPFGEEINYTNDSGQVVVNFPNDIKGDKDGNLVIVVKLEEDDNYGTVQNEQIIAWGQRTMAEDNPIAARSLIGSRNNAPWFMVIVINAILIGIWGYLCYIVYGLFKIKKLSNIKS